MQPSAVHVPSQSRKQKQIVESAIALFTRHGIRRVTVEEICREAGASKMTFYRYFTNKIELVKHIWTGWFNGGIARLAEIKAMEVPFAEKVGLLLEYKMEFLSAVSPELVSDLLHRNPELEDFVQELRGRGRQAFCQFLVEAQEKGDMRAGVRPEFVMVVMDRLHDMADDPHLLSIYSDPVELIAEINNFLFYGILPPPEREAGR